MRRRDFIGLPLCAVAGGLGGPLRAGPSTGYRGATRSQSEAQHSGSVKLFLCGDVMTGRGIDQIQRRASSPELYEAYVSSALDYITIAERKNGPIPRGVNPDYIWGDVLPVLDAAQPDARIVNLETAVTTSNDVWPGKGINYRMHPANTACLTAAGIDCCALANNHVLDWGYAGLRETLRTLRRAGINTAGAGNNIRQAAAPGVIEAAGARRVLVFSLGAGSSGIGRSWTATAGRAGVWRLPDLSLQSVMSVARQVHAIKQRGDTVLASVHWGSNWGYAVDNSQRRFAHALIDRAGVDLVHGHSSHHPRPIELYRNKLILYGCGDFINDYEGIRSHEQYRGDLVVAYLPVVDSISGELVRMRMHVMQLYRFRLRHAPPSDSRWLAAELDRESEKFGTRVGHENGELYLYQ